MKCQKCGTENNVHFTGSTCSWGPDKSDCTNTPENLPGGFAWLCDNCHYEIDPPDFSDCDPNSSSNIPTINHNK